MGEWGKVVSLCKAHGKLGSMTFAFDLMHIRAVFTNTFLYLYS